MSKSISFSTSGEQWVLVTPELAKQWLLRNTHNRNLAKSRVLSYAADMKSGRWLKTHQTIGFSTTGALIDGQHRLAAIIEAGVSIEFLVVCGCSMQSQLVVDGIKLRNPADSITLEGSAGAVSNKEIAIARMLAVGPEKAQSGAITTMALKSILEQHREAISFASNRQAKRRGMSAPVMSGLVHGRQGAAFRVLRCPSDRSLSSWRS